jgi:hypothetical protein
MDGVTSAAEGETSERAGEDVIVLSYEASAGGDKDTPRGSLIRQLQSKWEAQAAQAEEGEFWRSASFSVGCWAPVRQYQCLQTLVRVPVSLASHPVCNGLHLAIPSGLHLAIPSGLHLAMPSGHIGGHA